MSNAAPIPPTEQRSAGSMDLDLLETLDLLTLINAQDYTVPGAVRTVLPDLAGLVDRTVAALAAGGRVHYFGSGTSGRFGVLDAAEVPPTYGVPPTLFVAHLSGGPAAMMTAIEDAEDIAADGVAAAAGLTAADIAIGLSASGTTPYAGAALRAAREAGAYTVAITSNPEATIAAHADLHLYLPTGPEVVTGSTRMKAGTAEKLLLNAFSTAVMVRMGRTYSNLMIDVAPINNKLRRRVVRLLTSATGADEHAAAGALEAAGGDTKLALVMLLTGTDAPSARAALDESGGHARRAVARFVTERRAAAPGNRWLGIDIGASGFRVAMADGDEVCDAGRGTERPAITADGVDTAPIVQGLARLAEGWRHRGAEPAGDVDAVVIGMAGSSSFPGRSESFARQVAAITGARAVWIASDIVPSYVGALGIAPGAVLAAGTGAIALGTDLAAVTRRLDGLGHLIGDLGSGAWIGRQALQAALAPEIGRPVSSPALAVALRARFGGAHELVAALYGASDRSAILASFVPDVLAAADEGDDMADWILNQAADHLAQTLVAAGDGIGGPLAAVGGLVAPGSRVRDLLADRVELAAPRSSAAHGAAEMAQALRAGTCPPALSGLATQYA